MCQQIRSVLSALPGTFQASVVVVQHIAPKFPSVIASILKRSTPLTVTQARQGDILNPATVYIAPPDQHLLVSEDGSLILSQSEQVHYVRPSADVLFTSVAEVFGERAIAVILTGTGMDGAEGAQVVKQKGGIVIAQNRDTSEFFGMPDAAIHTGAVDMILPLDDIAQTLCKLVTSGV
jgi:two-component system chemotaxis response regulator CheB